MNIIGIEKHGSKITVLLQDTFGYLSFGGLAFIATFL